jgi:hypothetical protein
MIRVRFLKLTIEKSGIHRTIASCLYEYFWNFQKIINSAPSCCNSFFARIGENAIDFS